MTAVRIPFVDPIHRGARGIALVLEPEQRARVAHPNCEHLADVSPDLDAFFCRHCRWNGRVSGAWVFDMLAAFLEGTIEVDIIHEVRTCRVCGCTDLDGCVYELDGILHACWWIEAELCSRCEQ